MVPKKIGEENPANVAVIYCRYSSRGQRDVSIDQQIKACREYAEKNGIQIVDIYDDHAMTGTNDQRPAFQKMLLESSARAWSYVIVYAFDRFARDRYDSAVHKHTLKENGVKVISVTEQVSDDPTGALMESIFEGFAEYYSQELKRKILRGQQYNAEHGIAGAKTTMPLGYDRSATGRFVINPQEAIIVKEIFDKVASGTSYVEIFEELNRRGIKTKKGAEWNKSSFRVLLSNEKYIGTYKWGKIVAEDVIPPIIDKDTFAKVQLRVRAKRENADGTMRRRMGEVMYCLTGKLYCGKCGAPMIGVSGTGKGKKKFYYYVCKKRKARECDMEMLPREKIEGWVMSMVRDCLLTDDAIEWMATNAVKNDTARKAAELDLANVTAKMMTNEKAIKNYVKAIGEGILSDEIKEEINRLESEKEVLKSQMAYAELRLNTVFSYEQIKAGLQIIRERIDVQAPDLCLSLIDNFIRAIHYDGETLMIEVVYQKDDAHKEVSMPLTIKEIKEASYDTMKCSYKAENWR